MVAAALSGLIARSACHMRRVGSDMELYSIIIADACFHKQCSAAMTGSTTPLIAACGSEVSSDVSGIQSLVCRFCSTLA